MILNQQFEGHQTDPDTDGRICNVEGRPIESVVVEFEEIHHIPVPKTVDQVSQGSTEDEGQGQGQVSFILLQFDKEVEDDPDGGDGKDQKEIGSQAALCSPEDTEGSACVPDMREIEESLDHLHSLIEMETLEYHILGPLIHEEDPTTDN